MKVREYIICDAKHERSQPPKAWYRRAHANGRAGCEASKKLALDVCTYTCGFSSISSGYDDYYTIRIEL